MRPDVFLKVNQPETVRDTFEELIRDYPEISCEHPDHTADDEWRVMDKADFLTWQSTGIKPSHPVVM